MKLVGCSKETVVMAETFRIGTASGRKVDLKSRHDCERLRTISTTLGRPFADEDEVTRALRGELVTASPTSPQPVAMQM